MLNGIFTLAWSDVAKGLVVAVLTGIALPIAAAVQTPGFSFATVNWHGVLVLALNGAITGGVAYIAKNFLSDNQGRVFGRIG